MRSILKKKGGGRLFACFWSKIAVNGVVFWPCRLCIDAGSIPHRPYPILRGWLANFRKYHTQKACRFRDSNGTRDLTRAVVAPAKNVGWSSDRALTAFAFTLALTTAPTQAQARQAQEAIMSSGGGPGHHASINEKKLMEAGVKGEESYNSLLTRVCGVLRCSARGFMRFVADHVCTVQSVVFLICGRSESCEL